MVKRKLFIVLVLAALGALLLCSVAFGEDHPNAKKEPQALGKVTGDPQYQILNINNLWTWVRADGESNHAPSQSPGVEYPVFTGQVVYEDALVWGGKLFTNSTYTTQPTTQPIRIEGGTYSGSGYINTKAGWVTGSGATAVAADPNDPAVRAYRIRRDYASMSQSELIYDAQTYYEQSTSSAVTSTMTSTIYQRYDADWKAWKDIVPKGAPYIERNGQPGFQPPPAFNYDPTKGPLFTLDSLISGKYDEPGVAGADPNSPADQVIWLVYNDLDNNVSVKFTGSLPTGTEVQKTVWGYKRTDAMGNIYFNRYRLINKGGVDVGGGVRGSFWIDSAYVCQWSDIDLGNGGDDLVGSDSTMSLEYVYNGNPVDQVFAKFNLPPPCSGYGFLAGPEITSAGDSAVYGFKRTYGKKNLPMSSCVYFSAGSVYDDPGHGAAQSGGYNLAAYEWYAMLQGYAPSGTFGSPYSKYSVPPFVDPNTKYMFSGDPVAHTGFIDGLGNAWSFAPGDRRILLNSGPFRFAPGDTNDVYIGFVVGLGADRLSSVTVMKFNYQFVRNTFNALFQVPKAPQAPDVKVVALDQKVVLEWGSNASSVDGVENRVNYPGGYKFEGYNVYQFPPTSSSLKDAKRLATYDLPSDPTVVVDLQPVSGVIVNVPVQFGSNSGITRYFEFTQDKIRDIGSIFNGTDYYVAVTAYSVASVSGFLPTALESPPIVLTVTPHGPAFGTRLGAAEGDTIKPTHITGSSSATFKVQIINPQALTGDTYEVQSVQGPAKKIILSTGDTLNAFDNKYKVVDVTKGVTVIPTTAKFGIDPSNVILADGFQFGINATPYYVEGSEVSTTSYPTGWAAVNQLAPYVGGSGFFPGTLLPYQVTKSVEIDFLGTPNSKAAGGQNAYDFLRTATSGSGGAPYLGYFPQPFTVWDITDPSKKRQIDLAFMEAYNSTFYDSVWAPPAGSGDREYMWIIDQDYTPTAKAFYTGKTVNGLAGVPVLYAWWIIGPKPAYKAGDKLIVNVNVPLGTNDLWRFTTADRAMVATSDLRKADPNRITVFPNPYYCINSGETSRFNKWITFGNLPNICTIRIYNLAGQLVKILRKNDTSTFMRWDLANESAYPVASGMYIAHVEIPDAGSKVLKLAIIQEQELLDFY